MTALILTGYTIAMIFVLAYAFKLDPDYKEDDDE